jgi:hypothetical protein
MSQDQGQEARWASPACSRRYTQLYIAEPETSKELPGRSSSLSFDLKLKKFLAADQLTAAVNRFNLNVF